jgi:hypothetical protein
VMKIYDELNNQNGGRPTRGRQLDCSDQLLSQQDHLADSGSQQGVERSGGGRRFSMADGGRRAASKRSEEGRGASAPPPPPTSSTNGGHSHSNL